MRKTLCKTLSICLALLMLLSVGSVSFAEGNTVTLSGYEFSTEPVTLTAFVNWPNVYGEWGEDMVTQWITETCGVSIDIQWATTTTSEELNLMLASGDPLPDLIVTTKGSATANTLIRDELAEPLDVLAEKYFPGFMELLPDQMYEIYAEDDGHLYYTVDWFADTARLEALIEERGDLVQISGGNQTFLLNETYYEELGSPEIDTLEQFMDYLRLAHETYPEVRVPFTLANVIWDNGQDAVNYFYRLHGGTEWLYENEEGTISICIEDPAYKAALQDMNALYRDGVITDEALTLSYDDMTTILTDCDTFAYCGQDYSWFSKVPGGDTEEGPILPILAPMAEGLNREEDLQLKFGDISSAGGTTAVFVTIDSPNKARAIEYLAFRFTDEAQLAERYGIEGVTYEWNDDGTISWTDEYTNYLNEYGWTEMSKKYGPNNGVHSWFCTNYICKLESPESDYWVRAYNGDLHEPYMESERLLELTKIIDGNDDDIQMIYDRFTTHANESVIACITAESDEEFESAYNNYVETAKTIGLDKLEEYFTANYNDLIAKGLGD